MDYNTLMLWEKKNFFKQREHRAIALIKVILLAHKTVPSFYKNNKKEGED
jgi:hypothetical protein